MNASDYQAWMEKAFLYVEAALGQELATPSRVCMTEDYFRSSLVRGLAASGPEFASRIRTEEDAGWSSSGCWECATTQGQRRPIQHDLVVLPDNTDAGLACEVKWLKSAGASALGRDIWKLLLSRGTKAERTAMRTYLLLGGEGRPLSDTLGTLRQHRADLRWSNAGRHSGAPASRDFSITAFLGSALGARELEYIIGWGTNPRHRRKPPDCWAAARISRRFEPWVRTVDGASWRAVLFELHHHGAQNDDVIDWSKFRSGLAFSC